MYGCGPGSGLLPSTTPLARARPPRSARAGRQESGGDAARGSRARRPSPRRPPGRKRVARTGSLAPPTRGPGAHRASDAARCSAFRGREVRGRRPRPRRGDRLGAQVRRAEPRVTLKGRAPVRAATPRAEQQGRGGRAVCGGRCAAGVRGARGRLRPVVAERKCRTPLVEAYTAQGFSRRPEQLPPSAGYAPGRLRG